jgi:hypothetical protein
MDKTRYQDRVYLTRTSCFQKRENVEKTKALTVCCYNNWYKCGKSEKSCENKLSHDSTTYRFIYFSTWLSFSSTVELYTDKLKKPENTSCIWRFVLIQIFLKVIFRIIVTLFYHNSRNFRYKRNHPNDPVPVTVFKNKIIYLSILKTGVIPLPT